MSLQGASFAIVCDDVAVILGVENIMHFNNVGVI